MHRRHFQEQDISMQPKIQLKTNQFVPKQSLENIEEVQEDSVFRSKLDSKILPEMNKFSYQYLQRQQSNQDYPQNIIKPTLNSHSTQKYSNPSQDQDLLKSHSSQSNYFQKQPHQAYTYSNTTTTATAQSPFYISSEQLSQYEKYTSSIDKENKGFIAGSKAREIFMKSKLPIPMLKQIWALLDYKKKGYLTKYEFIGMVHIVRLCSNGIKIPLSLPNEISQLLAMHQQESMTMSNDLFDNNKIENGSNHSYNDDRPYRQEQNSNDNNLYFQNNSSINDTLSTNCTASTDAGNGRDIREFNHQCNQNNILNSKQRNIVLEDNLEKSRTDEDTQKFTHQDSYFQDRNPQKTNQQPYQNGFAYKQDNKNNNLARDQQTDFRNNVPQTPNGGHIFSKLETSFTKIETNSVHDSNNLSTSMDQSDVLSEVLSAFRETTKKVQEENEKLQEGLAKIKHFENHSIKKLEEIGRYFNSTVVNNSELSKELAETAKFSIQKITEKALQMLEINKQQNNRSQQENLDIFNHQEFLNSMPNHAFNFYLNSA